MLAGDVLISGAYQLIIDTDLPPAQYKNISQIFSRAIENVIMGELQDTEAVMDKIGTAQPLLIAELKTASYSFVGPLTTGAVLADYDDTAVASCAAFSTALGIAFQLRDDWLGLFGDTKLTGKSIDNDVREGKQTMLIEYAYSHASLDQQHLFDSIVGKYDATVAEVAEIRELVERLGAKKYVESLIESYTQKAQSELRTLDVNVECKKALTTLSEQLLQRQN
jgi:geranylgeranyl diphosphate synthase type II